MSNKKIEDFLSEALTGDALENASTFVAHLRAADMQIETNI